MRRRYIPAILWTLASGLCAARNPASAPAGAPAKIEEPQLIASQKVWTALGKCEKRRFEWARMVVDFSAEGVPQSIGSLELSKPEGKDLVAAVVQGDRLAPAEQDGRALTPHVGILMEMNACVDKVVLPDGKRTEQVWLDAQPKQTLFSTGAASAESPSLSRIGGHVSAPIPLNAPEARMTKDAIEDGVQGEVMVSLMVDANGMPQNPRVVRPLPAGLSEAALDAVRRYRFKPAMKDGKTPVPVMVTIAVNFRHY